jgi:hypothetical protein
MKGINKAYAYSKLSLIKDNYSIDTSRYIREVASTDEIPYSVITFINKYYPIMQLTTYNDIYEKRNSNPLYKNLVNENLQESERAIALSSLVTRSLIRAKTLNNDDRLEYMKIMNIDLICDTLCKYSLYNDTNKLNETFMMVRQVFKKLYS